MPGPIWHFDAQVFRSGTAPLTASHGDGVVPRVQKTVADQIKWPCARRVLRQFELYPVNASQPLVLPDAKSIQIVAIDFPNRLADISPGIVLRTGESSRRTRHIHS